MRHHWGIMTALACVAALAGLSACGGGDGDTLAAGAPTSRAMQEIPEGFDFLPPLHATKGLTTFNAQATPIVLVYAGTEANKGALLKRFETADITVETDHFHVNWDTNAEPGGLPDGTPNCVVEVWWETAGACDQMGFVDCIVDKPAGKGKKTSDPADYFFGLKDGRTLPIKFVVDQTVPAPVDITVTGIDPASAEQGTTLDATITGTGFKPGALVSLGAGITVNSVAWVSASSLTVNLTLAADATPGLRDVTVTNPWNKVATLSGAFEVTEPPRRLLASGYAGGRAVVIDYDLAASRAPITLVTLPASLYANGLAVGPDGKLYICGNSDFGRGHVHRCNLDGSGLEVVVSTGSAAFSNADQLAFDSTGALLVTDTAANAVKRVDVTTGAVSTFIASGVGGMSRPSGLAVSATGDVFVGNYPSGSNETTWTWIKRYDPAGGYLGDTVAAADQQLKTSNSLAFGPSGRLYANSNFNYRVLALDPVAVILDKVYPIRDGYYPAAITFGPGDKLYVEVFNTIWRCNADGSSWEAFVPAPAPGLSNRGSLLVVR